MSLELLTLRQIEILKILGDNVDEVGRQLLERTIIGNLPRSDIEAVCQMINDEYLMKGIKEDFNPNEYGHELETLLDVVNRLRIV